MQLAMSFRNMKSARTFQPTSSSVEKELVGLLKDEVFVDFFNTFLNLPVFGQTPLYYLSENKWFMCPEIPQNMEIRRGGYHKWLAGNRFVFFKHTDLYHYYMLCKELLGFTFSNSNEVLKWTIADEWLLKRSLGSVQGMKRFSAFVKGTQGKDLVLFWVRVGRLLQIDGQDLTRQRQRQVLFTLIKTVHLHDGSSLMRTCHITPDVLLKIFSDSHLEGKQVQILHRMKFKALSKLQHYWLLRFLYCCKASLARVKECASIAKQYQQLASQPTAIEGPSLLDLESWDLGSAPLGDGRTGTRPYSSRSTKRLLWRTRPCTAKKGRSAWKQYTTKLCQWLPMEGEGDQRGCTNIVHRVRKKDSSRRSKRSGLFRKVPSTTLDQCTGPLPALSPSNCTHSPDQSQSPPGFIPPHVCANTPACFLPSIVNLGPPPPPSLAKYGAPHRDEFLCSALSADALAGGPYETFLQARGLRVHLQHLAFWHDLDSLLNILLKTDEGHGIALRRSMGEKILADYFGHEGATRVKCITALTKTTTRNLRNALISGDVIPWICAAKHEICPVLAPTFDAFLKEDDGQLLLHLFGQMQSKVVCGKMAPSSGPNGPEQQLRRMREAMSLCQACCVYGDTEALTSEIWALMAVEDVTRGGSVNLHFKKTNLSDLPFETLVRKYPKMAVEKMSKAHRQHYNRKSDQEGQRALPTWQKKKFTLVKRKPSFSNRCHRRPRSLKEVMQNPSSLVYFKRFLEAYDAHGPLVFCQEVEQLRSVDQPCLLQAKINNIVARFFFHPAAEDYLQCSASLISQIPKMKHVVPDVIFTVQNLVIKSLEDNWLKKYQDTFPPSSDYRQGIVITNKLKHVWTVFTKLIKSVVEFRKAMRVIETRSKFEAYLRYSWADFSKQCLPTVGGNIHPVGLYAENGNSFCLKKRAMNNKLITVDFLVNDLSFYLDTESFRNMAGRGTMRTEMSGETTLLHQKAEMIIKLFLNSDIAPKLRINIEESTCESVQQSFLSGNVDSCLFHKAIMAVFPNLIFCWRKFRSQKAKKEVVKGRVDLRDSTVSPPDYLHPLSQGSDWYHKMQTTMSTTDDVTTLRFTVLRGLSLTLPRSLEFKVCSSALGPSKPRQGSGSTTGLSKAYQSDLRVQAFWESISQSQHLSAYV